jgi:Flp pilus assembly protein CpaB
VAIPTNKPQNRILLVGGIFFALLAGVVVYLAVSRSSSTGNPPTASVPVVVAQEEIPAGSSISAAMVTVADYPAANVPRDYFGSTSQAVGRTALVTISAGTPITSDLTATGGSTGATTSTLPTSRFTIADGYEALAIPASGSAAGTTVEQMTVGYYIQPGDQIDIIADLGGPLTVDHALVYAFQDVPVLAVGYTASAAPPASPSPGATAAAALQAPTYFVVEMQPAQAEEMTALLTQSFAQTSGNPQTAGAPPLVLKYLLRPADEYGQFTWNRKVTPNTVSFAPHDIALPSGALTPQVLCQVLGGSGSECAG